MGFLAKWSWLGKRHGKNKEKGLGESKLEWEKGWKGRDAVREGKSVKGARAAVVHLNFRAGSTFPVPVCTTSPGHTVNKADTH